MQPADRDLKDPVQVDPRRAFAREREDVSVGNLARLPDQIARSQMPVDVGILERKGAQQKRQDQEEDDQRPIERPASPRAIARNVAIAVARPARVRFCCDFSAGSGGLATDIAILSDFES